MVIFGFDIEDTIMRICFLLFLFPFLAFTQIQIGNDIDGENSTDSSGQSVCISANGEILAIGATSNDGGGFASGHVRVFGRESNSWVQIGEDIDGESSFDSSGISLSLSTDGSIIAIGARWNDDNGINSGHVRVFKIKSGTWVQMGTDIDGEAIGDISGFSTSLSSDGSVLAIGAPLNDGNGLNSGHVRVYRYESNNWVQIGTDIDGKTIGENFGNSISLSSDGSILAVGASGNNENGFESGVVRVYQNQLDNWVQLGSDIKGKAEEDKSGSAVSLSSNGSVLAIGAPGNDDNGSGSGHVKVYSFKKNTWVQVGVDINGEATGDGLGNSIGLSSDGSIIAVGASVNDNNGEDSGLVRIFQNQSDNWIQIGIDINGETTKDFSGESISLSSDGSVLAIGAPLNDGNGSDSGHVRVYNLSNILSVRQNAFSKFNIYPNPTKNILNIELNTNIDLKEVNISNIQGKQLYSTKQKNIDLSGFTIGIYFVEVVTDKGKSAKKIIKQ